MISRIFFANKTASYFFGIWKENQVFESLSTNLRKTHDISNHFVRSSAVEWGRVLPQWQCSELHSWALSLLSRNLDIVHMSSNPLFTNKKTLFFLSLGLDIQRFCDDSIPFILYCLWTSGPSGPLVSLGRTGVCIVKWQQFWKFYMAQERPHHKQKLGNKLLRFHLATDCLTRPEPET